MNAKKPSKPSKSSRKPPAKNTRREFLRKIAEMCEKQRGRRNRRRSESE